MVTHDIFSAGLDDELPRSAPVPGTPWEIDLALNVVFLKDSREIVHGPTRMLEAAIEDHQFMSTDLLRSLGRRLQAMWLGVRIEDVLGLVEVMES